MYENNPDISSNYEISRLIGYVEANILQECMRSRDHKNVVLLTEYFAWFEKSKDSPSRKEYANYFNLIKVADRISVFDPLDGLRLFKLSLKLFNRPEQYVEIQNNLSDRLQNLLDQDEEDVKYKTSFHFNTKYFFMFMLKYGESSSFSEKLDELVNKMAWQ